MSAERQQRLQHLHENLVQLIMHEGRFISERTNNFLLYNSFFPAGFLILRTQLHPQTGWSIAASAVISFVSIVFCILHFFVIGRNVAGANFWRSTIGLIEADPDFWWPKKALRDTDLDFFSARSRSLQGKKTRQGKQPLKLGGIPIEQKRAQRFFAPNLIFGTWLPVIMGLLWLVAFIWTMAAI